MPENLDLIYDLGLDIEQLESDFDDPGLSAKGKALISSAIAQEKYQRTGELADVFHEDGTFSKYVPTEAEIKFFESRMLLERTLTMVKWEIAYFVSIISISILAGVLTPLRNQAPKF